jgi:hypothetical protein
MASHTLLRAASALPLLRCVLPNAAASLSARGAASPWSARVPQLAGVAHTRRRYSASAAYTTGQPGMYAHPALPSVGALRRQSDCTWFRDVCV